jgi:hypothetical protein
MSEILGTATSALAVTELAAMVMQRCAQYWKDVSNARDDIARIERAVMSLKTVAEGVGQILEGPKEQDSVEPQSALMDGQAQLERLQEA